LRRRRLASAVPDSSRARVRHPPGHGFVTGSSLSSARVASTACWQVVLASRPPSQAAIAITTATLLHHRRVRLFDLFRHLVRHLVRLFDLFRHLRRPLDTAATPCRYPRGILEPHLPPPRSGRRCHLRTEVSSQDGGVISGRRFHLRTASKDTRRRVAHVPKQNLAVTDSTLASDTPRACEVDHKLGRPSEAGRLMVADTTRGATPRTLDQRGGDGAVDQTTNASCSLDAWRATMTPSRWWIECSQHVKQPTESIFTSVTVRVSTRHKVNLWANDQADLRMPRS